MNPPLVSVVIPVYNGEHFVSKAIESVLAQSYRPIEVIAVDDGSTDKTAEEIKSFEDVIYVYQHNQGSAAARNAGISKAQGDFLAFIDSDDTWTSNKLAVQVGYLLEHPEAGYVLAKQRIFVAPGTSKPSWVRKEHLQSDQTGFLPGTLVARKSIFEEIGMFDPKYKVGHDTDWLARAKDAGIQMKILPDVLLRRYIHGDNLTSNVEVSQSEMVALLKASLDRRRGKKKR